MKNEDRDILLPSQAVDSSRSGVATGRANYSEMMPFFPDLARIPPDKEVFEQVPQELQRNIFECVCRSVEELEEVEIVLLAESDQGSYFWQSEGGIASINDFFQVLRRDFGGRDVEGEEFECKLGEG